MGERFVINSLRPARHKIAMPIIKVVSVCGVDPIKFIVLDVVTHNWFGKLLTTRLAEIES